MTLITVWRDLEDTVQGDRCQTQRSHSVGSIDRKCPEQVIPETQVDLGVPGWEKKGSHFMGQRGLSLGHKSHS